MVSPRAVFYADNCQYLEMVCDCAEVGTLLVIAEHQALPALRTAWRAASFDSTPFVVLRPLLNFYWRTRPIWAECWLRDGVVWGEWQPHSSPIPITPEMGKIESAWQNWQQSCALVMQSGERIPPVIAVYEELDHGFLVVPNETERSTIDGVGLSQKFKQFVSWNLCTEEEFGLLAHSHLALSLGIGRYRWMQGKQLLQDRPILLNEMITNAQEEIILLLVEQLPPLYFSADEQQLTHLIHDIQNKLLKVQFQYDLLTMLHDLPRLTTPRLQVDRTQSFHQRIIHIADYLQAWLKLYQTIKEQN